MVLSEENSCVPFSHALLSSFHTYDGAAAVIRVTTRILLSTTSQSRTLDDTRSDTSGDNILLRFILIVVSSWSGILLCHLLDSPL